MNHDFNPALLITARLFDFPDEAWRRRLPEIREAAAGLSDANRRDGTLAFIDAAASASLLEWQEQYTATFDLTPANSLDLTHHLHGDSQERLAALERLQQAFVDAGFERVGGVLPDFLPLILEFLSVTTDEPAAAVLRIVGPGLAALNARLLAARSPYAALTTGLVELLGLSDGQPFIKAETTVMEETP